MFSTELAGNKRTSDLLGAMASGLCLIHCLATPFLFMVQAEVAHHHAHEHAHGDIPLWWGLIDSVLLVVSFFAVFWAARNSTKTWMKYALYATWIALAFIILNEKIGFVHLPEEIIYIPTIGLIGLHLYNRKYCCEDESCKVEVES